MFDSEYFRTTLQADVDAVGGGAVVTIHLVSGRSHRVRSVLAIHAGYVTVESYDARSEATARDARWKAEPRPGGGALETSRAVLGYEGIADVTITPVRAEGAAGIGFARGA